MGHPVPSVGVVVSTVVVSTVVVSIVVVSTVVDAVDVVKVV